MRFQMKANPGSEDCSLGKFELDLVFSPIMNQTLGPEPRSTMRVSADLSEEPAQVGLIGPPAPLFVSPETKTWSFSSDRIADDESGQELTAR